MNGQINSKFKPLKKRQNRQILSLDMANSRHRPPKSMIFVYVSQDFLRKRSSRKNCLPVFYFSLFAESLETLGRKRGQDILTSLRAKKSHRTKIHRRSTSLPTLNWRTAITYPIKTKGRENNVCSILMKDKTCLTSITRGPQRKGGAAIRIC